MFGTKGNNGESWSDSVRGSSTTTQPTIRMNNVRSPLLGGGAARYVEGEAHAAVYKLQLLLAIVDARHGAPKSESTISDMVALESDVPLLMTTACDKGVS